MSILFTKRGEVVVKWDTLFDMQQKLDTYIINNHNLQNEDLFDEKVLALLVELGELANETRCFKFWSTQDPNETEVILEEYVDNIHFLLSIGLEKGFTFTEGEIIKTTRSKTEQFNKVFEMCMNFHKEQSKANYIELFTAYLQLASLLGFTENDIQQAYYKKNEVNFARQDAGY